MIYRNYGNFLYGVRYGAKLALPMQNWPQKGLSTPTPPIFTSSMLLLRADATELLPWMTLRLGWGCISSGEGPSSGLQGNSKVGRSTWFLVVNLSFIHELLLQKENIRFAPKLERNGQIMVKIVLYGGHRLVRSDTVILADRILDHTVRSNYGQYRNYVPNPTLWRKCTHLVFYMFYDRLSYLGLVITIYLHRVWPYEWGFSC